MTAEQIAERYAMRSPEYQYSKIYKQVKQMQHVYTAERIHILLDRLYPIIADNRVCNCNSMREQVKCKWKCKDV